jgi:hypothetical protein
LASATRVDGVNEAPLDDADPNDDEEHLRAQAEQVSDWVSVSGKDPGVTYVVVRNGTGYPIRNCTVAWRRFWTGSEDGLHHEKFRLVPPGDTVEAVPDTPVPAGVCGSVAPESIVFLDTKDHFWHRDGDGRLEVMFKPPGPDDPHQ